MERDFDPRREAGDHALFIERNDSELGIGKFIGQEAYAWPESVVGVGDGQANGDNLDFEHVSGFGSFDVDGTGENVAARAAIFYLAEDVAQRLLDLGRGHARGFELLGIGSDQRLDFYGVAGLDAEDGGGFGVVIAEDDGLGGGLEGIRRRGAVLLSDGHGTDEEQHSEEANRANKFVHEISFGPHCARNVRGLASDVASPARTAKETTPPPERGRPRWRSRWALPHLENILQPKLDEPRRHRGGLDFSEARGAKSGTWICELCVVEGVVEVGAEFQGR